MVIFLFLLCCSLFPALSCVGGAVLARLIPRRARARRRVWVRGGAGVYSFALYGPLFGAHSNHWLSEWCSSGEAAEARARALVAGAGFGFSVGVYSPAGGPVCVFRS